MSGSIYNETARRLRIAAKKFKRSPGADPAKATLVNVFFGAAGIEWMIPKSNGDLAFDPQKTVFEIPPKGSATFKISADANFEHEDLEELHATYVGFIVDQDSFEIVGGGTVTLIPFTGEVLFCYHTACDPKTKEL